MTYLAMYCSHFHFSLIYFTTQLQGKSKGGPSIEDWELPPRYRRRTIDDKEIDAINSGGAY